MEDAICNWLGDAFEEDEELSIIELEIAPERLVIPEDLYEAYILETVEPSCIVRIVAEQEWGVSVEKHPEAATPLEEGHRL